MLYIYIYTHTRPPTQSHTSSYRATGGQTVEYPADMPPPARDLIARLLEVDPKKRLGANGAAEIRSHAFFQDLDWQALVDHKITPPIRPHQGQV